LKGGVINTGEVATSGRLVFLRAKSEGIHVNTGVGVAGVVLERLDNIEVGTLTLGEAVLAVKLKLSGDDRVLTPAMHVEGSLGKNECSGVRDVGTLKGSTGGSTHRGLSTEDVGFTRGELIPLLTVFSSTHSSRVLEKTTGSDEGIRTRGLVRATESVDGVGKSVNSISVVERLGTKGLVKGLTTLQRGTVINIGVRLNNPDKLLTGVVEVELDLVAGRTNRLVTSELKLFNEILVRVLGHLSALVSV
jgi:hypothetical protein